MSNLDLYNAVRMVPETAKREIKGGRLAGKTDINPMWRIKTLTEHFGPVGFGWYYSVIEQRLESAPNGEISAFVQVELFVKDPLTETWSKPIVGLGGASFVANEKSGPYVSDECFKMALTDALSVACKALGFGADVYWSQDAGKYTKPDAGRPEPSAKKRFDPDWFNDESSMARITAALKRSTLHPEDQLRNWYDISHEDCQRIVSSYL